MSDSIVKKVYLIKKHFQKFLNYELAKYDLKSSEAFFIEILHREGMQTQATLSRFAGCNKSHTHRIIAKLIEKKLIIENEIDFNSHHTKNILYKLTEQGKKIAQTIKSTIIAKWDRQLKLGISDSDIIVAKNVIEKIYENSYSLVNESRH